MAKRFFIRELYYFMGIGDFDNPHLDRRDLGIRAAEWRRWQKLWLADRPPTP